MQQMYNRVHLTIAFELMDQYVRINPVGGVCSLNFETYINKK